MKLGTEKKSLTQVAYERIKGDILSLRLMSRQPLVEAELAAEYGMSKTPVREALLSLAREGLVELNSFRGGRVRDFTAREVRELYELRALMEPFALSRAMPLMTVEDRKTLRSLLNKARDVAERGDHRELSGLNRSFHGALFAKCDNVRLVEMLTQFQDQLRVISLRFWHAHATYIHEAGQHEAILEAVEAGDADLAAERLREHIVEFAKAYSKEAYE
jgi:DNA-binding GntR family transcriptional regulator